MPGKLSKCGYSMLIAENIEWLKTMPRSLERDHIIDVLNASVDFLYPHGAKEQGMTDDRKDREIELLALRAELEGMLADNVQRIFQGDSIAWNYEAFMSISERIRALRQ